MRIAAASGVLPPNYYPQQTLLAAVSERLAANPDAQRRLAALHRNVRVGGRYLALPLQEYSRIENWGQANNAWIEAAIELGGQALAAALMSANLEPQDLHALFFVSVTGMATPSIDARLMNRMPLRLDLKRVPIFGLGCVAGAAGLARAADYVRAFPGEAAAVLAVELCSLTLQPGDLSVANLVATGLFGDGAACAIVLGTAHRSPATTGTRRDGPDIIATRSIFYPRSEEIMGWNITDRGLGIILSAAIPALVRSSLRRDVDSFLAAHGLSRPDIGRWICHPGGPRVLEAMEEAMEIPRTALQATWDSLSRVGNLSSASVLFILEESLQRPPPAGTHGLLLAMGPGFCTELVLVRW